MPSPFPGMDPYLEQSMLWPSFHAWLMIAIAETLSPNLRPKYYIAVETRTYTDEDQELLVGILDAMVLSSAQSTTAQPSPEAEQPALANVATQVKPGPIKVRLPMPMEVREHYLEVREVGSDAVITVIEVLSPKNKRIGVGREAYEKKRQKVLASLSHLIEIDLLRGGGVMSMGNVQTQTHYRILVSREPKRPTADLYGFNLQDGIPAFPLPLKLEDAELMVDLQAIVNHVYELGSYDIRINYQQPVPSPALLQIDHQWLNHLLHPDNR